MSVEFSPEPSVADLARRSAEFIRETVIPVEEQCRGVARSEKIRIKLQQAAKEASVFAPHVGTEFGGHGLDMRGRAAVYEETGYSLLGPPALNIAAPDEGATCTCSKQSQRLTRRPVPASARCRGHPLLLRHDRADLRLARYLR